MVSSLSQAACGKLICAVRNQLGGQFTVWLECGRLPLLGILLGILLCILLGILRAAKVALLLLVLRTPAHLGSAAAETMCTTIS